MIAQPEGTKNDALSRIKSRDVKFCITFFITSLTGVILPYIQISGRHLRLMTNATKDQLEPDDDLV